MKFDSVAIKFIVALALACVGSAFAVNAQAADTKINNVASGCGTQVEELYSGIEGAVSIIRDNDKIFVPIGAGVSPEGVSAIMKYAGSLPNGVDIHLVGDGVTEERLKAGLAESHGKARLHALFLGRNGRKLNRAGQIQVIPGYLGDFTRLMKRPENVGLHYDAILVKVAPADENGHYSLGPNNDMIMTIIRNRPHVKIIAEVNPNVPHTTGKNFLTAAQITSSFRGEAPMSVLPSVPYTDVERAIGQNLGSLIEDNSVLQIGIGNIFTGLADGLTEFKRQNIQIRSEMFGDPLMEVVKRGLAKSAQCGFAFGSKDLYQWLDYNKNVEFIETEEANNPSIIQNTANMHAVNTALQVSLRGDINATMGPDNYRISSPGGQVEFMSAAARADNGKAIIAIRSTAQGGTVSTIVLNLYAGPVTTPHESVTHVVTEYGIAKLSGKTEAERTLALINVAHPKFREQLRAEALAAGLIH